MVTAEPTETISSNNSNKVTLGQVHFVLQGKGGVGRSLISSLLVQYLREKGEAVLAIDTDTVNATLSGYTAFNTQSFDFMEDGSFVERKFNLLIERIINEDAYFVIDTSTASFIPFSRFLSQSTAINRLASRGRKTMVHTIVTGGQALRNTLAGFVSLAEQIPNDIRIVIWLNEFFGLIEANGKTFEEMRAYQKPRGRIHGLVRIERQSGTLFVEDIEKMLKEKITFEEVNQSLKFYLMSRSRLFQVKKAIFRQLEVII